MEIKGNIYNKIIKIYQTKHSDFKSFNCQKCFRTFNALYQNQNPDIMILKI